MQIVCCKCQRLKGKKGWSRRNPEPGKISHGYCPKCYRETMVAIQRYGRDTLPAAL
ncbi:MAG: hypothetical protein AB1568_01680 [Thermodesulfobacteriota bacterium]